MDTFQTGDIIIFKSGFGHVAMCFEPGSNNEKTTFIHAKSTGNFHITEHQQINDDGSIAYMVDKNYWQFRLININDADKVKLKKAATAVSQKAKYGIGRAIRLAVGNSSFDDGARKRLAKYQIRFEEANPEKLITTITCSEAIIICYQLTFNEAAPQFIKKDAAHTMPRTLAQYLAGNKESWITLKNP